jgi:hypothetical protein
MVILFLVTLATKYDHLTDVISQNNFHCYTLHINYSEAVLPTLD